METVIVLQVRDDGVLDWGGSKDVEKWKNAGVILK